MKNEVVVIDSQVIVFVIYNLNGDSIVINTQINKNETQTFSSQSETIDFERKNQYQGYSSG